MLKRYNNDINFEYDPHKSLLNQRKHGISLEEAKQLWLGPIALVEARFLSEPRSTIIGEIEGKRYACAFTIRGQAIRLISARRARKQEEAIYEQNIQQKTYDSR